MMLLNYHIKDIWYLPHHYKIRYTFNPNLLKIAISYRNRTTMSCNAQELQYRLMSEFFQDPLIRLKAENKFLCHPLIRFWLAKDNKRSISLRLGFEGQNGKNYWVGSVIGYVAEIEEGTIINVEASTASLSDSYNTLSFLISILVLGFLQESIEIQQCIKL